MDLTHRFAAASARPVTTRTACRGSSPWQYVTWSTGTRTMLMSLTSCFKGIGTSPIYTAWSGDNHSARDGRQGPREPEQIRTGQASRGSGWRVQSKFDT
jgi:hypothetical protein